MTTTTMAVAKPGPTSVGDRQDQPDEQRDQCCQRENAGDGKEDHRVLIGRHPLANACLDQRDLGTRQPPCLGDEARDQRGDRLVGREMVDRAQPDQSSTRPVSTPD